MLTGNGRHLGQALGLAELKELEGRADLVADGIGGLASSAELALEAHHEGVGALREGLRLFQKNVVLCKQATGVFHGRHVRTLQHFVL